MQKLTWQKQDILWVLSLFGTAVGAGILFLPIEAGLGGIWPLILLTLFTMPMVYLSHKFFAYFVLSAKNEVDDITLVARTHFGLKIGTLINVLYFLAIFPILLVYGVGLTNTLQSVIINQLHLPQPNRLFLSFSITAIMISIMYFGEKLMLTVTEFLVFPLVFLLFCISIYLIPSWNLESIRYVPPTFDFFKSIVLTLPVLIFAFNHSPAISSFVLSQRKTYHEKAEKKVVQILQTTSTVLFVFVMFFVFSCVLSLSPTSILVAKSHNVSVMTYLANTFENPFFATVASLIAIVAITSSFFGHYLGAREGLNGLMNRLFETFSFKIKQKNVDLFVLIFFFVSIWGIAYLNPSILKLLEVFIGPIIAVLLFIMPIIAIYRVQALNKYRGQYLKHGFVLIIGLLSVSVMAYSILRLFI